MYNLNIDPPPIPFIPDKVNVYETEKIRFYGSKLLILENWIQTLNVPFGTYFKIIHKFEYNLIDDDPTNVHTKVTASVGFQWLKSTWGCRYLIEIKLCLAFILNFIQFCFTIKIYLSHHLNVHVY